jgi:hypothetical protein
LQLHAAGVLRTGYTAPLSVGDFDEFVQKNLIVLVDIKILFGLLEAVGPLLFVPHALREANDLLTLLDVRDLRRGVRVLEVVGRIALLNLL